MIERKRQAGPWVRDAWCSVRPACDGLPGKDTVSRGMIRGIHHFGLTVRDVDASTAWYEEAVGFRRVGEFQALDETRAGLDHLAFTAADRRNSTPGRRGWRTPLSSIPRSRRRTPYRARP